MKKEIEICDKCNKNIAIGKCDVCNSDVCKVHGQSYNVDIGYRHLTKIMLCYLCQKELMAVDSTEVPAVKKAILDAITKEITLNKLK